MRAGSQTQDTCSGALIVLFLLLSQASASCTISDVMRVDSIVTSCCESQVDGNCADGFPATCTHSCATVLVPYWAECAGMVTSLGDATFPTFQISELSEFVGPCIQTINLYEHAATSTCANANLAAQVEAINTACCEQNGEYVCGDGAPSVCDAECAFAFIPYWMNCIVLDDELHDIADIREFQDLHNICAEEMDAGEVAILYDDVVGLAQNPSCHIDTSGIISATDAKAAEPACETDTIATAVCEQFIAGGQLTCESDMCPLCGQRHSCDHTCEFPCAEPDDARAGRRLAEVTYTPINFGLDGAVDAAQTCPLNEFGTALAEVSEACCYEHSRDNSACGAASFSKLESTGCLWSDFVEDVDWRYFSEEPTSLDDCATACCDADDCTGFKHPEDNSYCAFWMGQACSGSYDAANNPTNTVFSEGTDTYVLANHPLTLIPGEFTWVDAEAACESRGLVLARVDSEWEWAAAMNVTGMNGAWIGLHDSEVEGEFRWMDGGEMHSSFWSPGEPNNAVGNCAEGEDCVHIFGRDRAGSIIGGNDEQHSWNDFCCNSTAWDSFDALCEEPPTPVEETCPRGRPISCSFDCGQVFTQFMDACGDMLEILMGAGSEGAMAEYTSLERQCVQMDPTSMVMAMSNTECNGGELCGNGRLEAGEECDAGAENLAIAHRVTHDFIVSHLGECTVGCYVLAERILNNQYAHGDWDLIMTETCPTGQVYFGDGSACTGGGLPQCTLWGNPSLPRCHDDSSSGPGVDGGGGH